MSRTLLATLAVALFVSALPARALDGVDWSRSIGRPQPIAGIPPGALEYRDGILYVAGNDLMICDAADPVAPAVLSTLSLPGTPQRVRLVERNLWLPCGEGGAVWIDVSDPARPAILGVFAPGTTVVDVRYDGSHAHVVSLEGDFYILSVSPSEGLTPISQLSDLGETYSLTLKDAVAMAGTWDGLALIDVSDAEHPVVVDYRDENADGKPGDDWSHFGRRVWDMAIIGDLAYAATSKMMEDQEEGGYFFVPEVVLYDVTDPLDPDRLSTYRQRDVRRVKASSERVVFAARNLLATDPADLAVRIELHHADPLADVVDLGHGFIGATGNGLVYWEDRGGDIVRQAGALNPSYSPLGMGGRFRLFLTRVEHYHEYTNLYHDLFDMADPLQPLSVWDDVDLNAYYIRIIDQEGTRILSDDYTQWYGGFHICDFAPSPPAEGGVTGKYPTFDGDILWYFAHLGGPLRLCSADISDVGNIVELGVLLFGEEYDLGYCPKLLIDGGLGLIVTYNEDLIFLDLVDPANPLILDTLDFPLDYELEGGSYPDCRPVALRDRLIYAPGDAGFTVIDCQDPHDCVVLASCPIPPTPSRGTFGDRFVALKCEQDGTEGFVVVSLADPRRPLVAWPFTAADSPDFAISGDYLYVAEDNGNIQLIDCSTPDEPQWIGYAHGQAGRATCIVGGALVSGTATFPLHHLDPAAAEDPQLPQDPQPDLPAAPTLTSIAPNPFNPHTRVSFTLPRSAAVDLAVYDLRGHRVRRLLHRDRLPAGPATFDWDGCADDGHDLPSGTYIFRLATDERISTAKAVLVR